MKNWLSQTHFESWRSVVPELEKVLNKMNEKTIIGIGSLPYPRIMPALFLKTYQIYCVADVADNDVLRHYTNIFSMAEREPKVAQKVQSTNYLLGNYLFQSFLKSRRYPFKLYLQQTTPPIIKKLEELGVEWIGNDPTIVEEIKLKATFRQLLKKLNLPHLPDHQIPREKFLAMTWADLEKLWNKAVVIQRGDKEVGGVQGTFFVKNESDWKFAHERLVQDKDWQLAQVSPFVQGQSVSMLGCITPLGVLTSALQLQLIDVPEALAGAAATGQFLGHDWAFTNWPPSVEAQAQTIMESLGAYLAKHDFKGIFGIDFMYDSTSHELFPTECNPRSTGALPLHSLMIYGLQRVPPLDFFHLMAHLNIHEFFDFAVVNRELKKRFPLAHISLVPFGLPKFNISLEAGIYTYNQTKNEIHFKATGAFPWHIQEPNDFLIIDSIPRPSTTINQNVPRLFKLIFHRQIAESSYKVDEQTAAIINVITHNVHA